MNSYLVTLIIVCVCAFIFILMYMYHKQPTLEGFIPGPCPNCGQRNKLQCFDCSSCGWCLTPNGYGECVPGNSNGPYFRQDCLAWEYNPTTFFHRRIHVPVRRLPIPVRRRPAWHWRRQW